MPQMSVHARIASLCGCQVVSRSGEVAFEDVWLFGHRDPAAFNYFSRIAISPVASTTAPPQVLTLNLAPTLKLFLTLALNLDPHCDSKA